MDKDFYEHYKIHEYRTRVIVGDEEQVVLYSVFFVVAIDTENEYVDEIDTNPRTKNVWGGVGKFTPYFIHTKLNLNTGELNSKKTEASFNSTNQQDGIRYVNGITTNPGYADLPSSSRASMATEFPFGALCIYTFNNNYVTSGHMFRIRKFSASVFNSLFYLVDISPVFTKAYEEDWISKYTWDNTGYTGSYISFNRIKLFLNLAYYHGTFYGYKNGAFITYPEVSPCTTPNTSTGVRNEYNYGDLTSTLNYAQIVAITNSFSFDTYDNLLDLTSWGQYNATQLVSAPTATNPAKTTKRYGPSFAIDVNQYSFSDCYEYHGRVESYMNLLAQTDLNYILNDPIGYDTVPLESYEVISEEANLTTKFAHNFAVNDTVSITGAQDINGTYTVTEVTTNLNFKVSVTVDDTDGLVATNGTATKQ